MKDFHPAKGWISKGRWLFSSTSSVDRLMLFLAVWDKILKCVCGPPSAERQLRHDSEPGTWFALGTVLTLTDARSKTTTMMHH